MKQKKVPEWWYMVFWCLYLLRDSSNMLYESQNKLKCLLKLHAIIEIV